MKIKVRKEQVWREHQVEEYNRERTSKRRKVRRKQVSTKKQYKAVKLAKAIKEHAYGKICISEKINGNSNHMGQSADFRGRSTLTLGDVGGNFHQGHM